MEELIAHNDGGFVPSTPELEVAKVYEYKELPREEEERLVDLLADRKKGPLEKKYAVYLVEGTDEAAKLGRSLEVEVFGEFFQNDEALMQREYQPYEEQSKFLLVVDHEGKKAAGVMRLISNSEAGLKSLNDLAHEPWNKPVSEIFAENNIKPEDLPAAWDIATLAVTKEYRGKTSVASALYHGLYRGSVEQGIKEWVAVLDDNVLELLEALGLYFDRYQGLSSGSYLDSPASTPVYANVDSIINNMSEKNPDAHSYLALGQLGIDKNIDFSEIYTRDAV